MKPLANTHRWTNAPWWLARSVARRYAEDAILGRHVIIWPPELAGQRQQAWPNSDAVWEEVAQTYSWPPGKVHLERVVTGPVTED